MGDQWISEHSLAEPPDSIFSIANWFKYIEHKDVKQLCISRSVLLGMHFEEQCCVGEMFENNSTLISFDGQITCFPNLEKLWLWEGDATWPEGWEPEYERDAEKIEDFLNREDQDITPPEGLTEDDLTLIWHHKESTEPCVQCGSQGHRSACGPSPLTVNFWRGYPYEDLETGKPNFS